MLKIAHGLHQLHFFSLMQVYEEGNRENGADRYPDQPEYRQLQLAESDFYDFAREFFAAPGAMYAGWDLGGRSASALRLEPYQDGLLLEALETAPDLRRRGYAKTLILETLVAWFTCDSELPAPTHLPNSISPCCMEMKTQNAK